MRLCLRMDGILLQTTRSIRALIGVATEGSPPEDVEIAYRALRDQWAAAEREAMRGTSDPVIRFDARAAAVLGAAYRPVLHVLCSGKGLRSEDVELAQRSSGWLNLAYEALQAGDQANVERCLKMASTLVADERDAPESLPPA
jgi:hypothetical protein